VPELLTTKPASVKVSLLTSASSPGPLIPLLAVPLDAPVVNTS
jgi:hypothetical protein